MPLLLPTLPQWLTVRYNSMKFMTSKITKLLILSLVVLLQTSCQKWVANILPGRPDKEFRETLRDASPDFREGWEDGCEVAMSNGASNFYRIFYRNNKVNGYKMSSSSDYKTGWGNAFWYCHRYDYVKQKSSIWGSVFTGYQ